MNSEHSENPGVERFTKKLDKDSQVERSRRHKFCDEDGHSLVKLRRLLEVVEESNDVGMLQRLQHVRLLFETLLFSLLPLPML